MEIEKLDADELLHLALEAMERNDNKDALTLLKQSVIKDPGNGQAKYLLGAVYAQIGMYDRAVSEMSRAVELLPELYPAHFQLGLLYMTSGKVEKAKNAWLPLENLDSEHPFQLFKQGLEHLVEDDFESCISFLKRGIDRNRMYASLNDDMVKVINSAQQALKNSNSAVKNHETSAGRHALLSSYQHNESSED